MKFNCFDIFVFILTLIIGISIWELLKTWNDFNLCFLPVTWWALMEYIWLMTILIIALFFPEKLFIVLGI